MVARKLRAVSPDEAQIEKSLTLAEAVETGDYRKILAAQRLDIVRSLPDERGPAKAALHRQLSLISKELEALELRAKQEANEDGVSADEAWSAEAL